MKHRTVCDVREIATMTRLRKLGALTGRPLEYIGPDLCAHPVYALRLGVVERVARDTRPDPHPMPVEWRSPLERTP